MRKLLVFVLLTTMILLSSCDTGKSENDVNIIVQDGYIDGFPNQIIRDVYLEYNEFFGGYYLSDGQLYLCVTDLAVRDLLPYEVTDTTFIKVEFSYGELLSVMTVIVNNIEEYNINTVTLDMSENSLIVYMDVDQETHSHLTHYEEIGIITIIKSNGVNGFS